MRSLLFATLFSGILFLSCARNYNYRTLSERIDAGNYFYTEGLYALARKEAAPALAYFSEAIRILPDFAAAYYQRARIYYAAKFNSLAERNFKQAQSLSLEYAKLTAVEPLKFELSKADIEVIKSVPPPADAALVADKPAPLEKLRPEDKMDPLDEE